MVKKEEKQMLFLFLNDIYCLVTVALAGCDDVAPAPEAVALLTIETAFIFSKVMVYVAVQVTIALGANVTLASPQLNGVGLIKLSLIVNCAGPRVVVPLLVMA